MIVLRLRRLSATIIKANARALLERTARASAKILPASRKLSKAHPQQSYVCSSGKPDVLILLYFHGWFGLILPRISVLVPWLSHH